MLVAERLAGQLETVFDGRTSPIARDLKLNLRKLLTEGALASGEAGPALLAVASAVHHSELIQIARDWLVEDGFPEAQIHEAQESAALMTMLNTYYRFRGKLVSDEGYGPVGLRMTALARPALGKTRFEMLAFAVSVVNGCGTCIASHERTLHDAGIGVDKLHDLARLAAVVAGVRALG